MAHSSFAWLISYTRFVIWPPRRFAPFDDIDFVFLPGENISKQARRDGKHRMITNQSPGKIRRKLNPALAVLYYPMDLQWSYSHHAAICQFKGRYYAMWSNGERDEDDLRQRVLFAVSPDGVHWSQHETLYPSQEGCVLTACGFYQHNATLAAYAGRYAYAPENVANGRYLVINDFHRNTTLLAKTTADGVQWSDPIDLQLPIIPNYGPQPLAGGRLLLSGNVTYPYTDDAGGLSGWRVGGLEPHLGPDFSDDSEGLMRHTGMRGGGVLLCEGSFFQTEDQTVHMLLRSDKRRLYETVSTDSGETWSAAKPTNFAAANTKFHFGQLPDGRYYFVGSPDPAGARCPLVVSVSRDGMDFDREYIIDERYRPLRMPGKYKGGIYGYPHSYIVDGKMFVICSINKEDIHVYSFALDQLDEND